MTRAIGDKFLRRYGVVPEPDVCSVPRHESDEFLILASDGLWNTVSNQEAVNVVQLCMARAASKGADRATGARVAAKVLIRAALERGGRDNVTVIVVDLRNTSAAATTAAPKAQPSMQAQQQASHPQPPLPQQDQDVEEGVKAPVTPPGVARAAAVSAADDEPVSVSSQHLQDISQLRQFSAPLVGARPSCVDHSSFAAALTTERSGVVAVKAGFPSGLTRFHSSPMMAKENMPVLHLIHQLGSSLIMRRQHRRHSSQLLSAEGLIVSVSPACPC